MPTPTEKTLEYRILRYINDAPLNFGITPDMVAEAVNESRETVDAMLLKLRDRKIVGDKDREPFGLTITNEDSGKQINVLQSLVNEEKEISLREDIEKATKAAKRNSILTGIVSGTTLLATLAQAYYASVQARISRAINTTKDRI